MKKYFCFFLLFFVGCRVSLDGLSGIDKPDLLELHNQRRSEANVPALTMHLKLDEAAQGHADWMASANKMSHTGKNGSSISDRVKKDWTVVGENIAYGQENVERVVADWMASKGHRANILNPNFKFVGFGICEKDGRIYWCAAFSN